MSAQLANLSDARRMTPEQYTAARDDIRATYGDSNAEAHAMRDQALAALFHRSGWTQEELAKAEHIGPTFALYRIRFGRFLSFLTTGEKSQSAPRNLTERRFRGYWSRTDMAEKNERIRFRAVLDLIEQDTRVGKTTARKPKVAEAILDEFADGKWHQLPTIVGHTKCEAEDVRAVLEGMIVRGSYGTHCERKKVGKTVAYRLVRKSGKAVALGLLIQELEPLLTQLADEGKKSMATISPSTVAKLTQQLRTAIERLAK